MSVKWRWLIIRDGEDVFGTNTHSVMEEYLHDENESYEVIDTLYGWVMHPEGQEVIDEIRSQADDYDDSDDVEG